LGAILGRRVGFKVQRSEFGVWGLGNREKGVAFRVWGVGIRVCSVRIGV
jgi:hypothetical protein